LVRAALARVVARAQDPEIWAQLGHTVDSVLGPSQQLKATTPDLDRQRKQRAVSCLLSRLYNAMAAEASAEAPHLYLLEVVCVGRALTDRLAAHDIPRQEALLAQGEQSRALLSATVELRDRVTNRTDELLRLAAPEWMPAPHRPPHHAAAHRSPTRPSSLSHASGGRSAAIRDSRSAPRCTHWRAGDVKVHQDVSVNGQKMSVKPGTE
jgi:hypothetical protein